MDWLLHFLDGLVVLQLHSPPREVNASLLATIVILQSLVLRYSMKETTVMIPRGCRKAGPRGKDLIP